MKDRIPQSWTAGGDLSPCGEIREGSSAVPWCMKPLSHSSTPRISASSRLLQSPCTRGQIAQRKQDGAEERKTNLVLKESEQSTLHDYREPGCSLRPAGAHINHTSATRMWYPPLVLWRLPYTFFFFVVLLNEASTVHNLASWQSQFNCQSKSTFYFAFPFGPAQPLKFNLEKCFAVFCLNCLSLLLNLNWLIDKTL